MPETDNPIYIEIEVEYVRTAKILFTVEPDSGMSMTGVPMPVGRVLRTMQYWLHRGKSLGRGEQARLVRWNIQSDHDLSCEKVSDHFNVDFNRPCECQQRLVARLSQSMNDLHEMTG